MRRDIFTHPQDELFSSKKHSQIQGQLLHLFTKHFPSKKKPVWQLPSKISSQSCLSCRKQQKSACGLMESKRVNACAGLDLHPFAEQTCVILSFQSSAEGNRQQDPTPFCPQSTKTSTNSRSYMFAETFRKCRPLESRLITVLQLCQVPHPSARSLLREYCLLQDFNYYQKASVHTGRASPILTC